MGGVMHILGIVGGIASGKSTVSTRLSELGAVVLDADKAAHEALNQRDVQKALVARWGPEILDGQGQVDRKAIAGRIFATPVENPEDLSEQQAETQSNRLFLEQTIHPRVHQQFVQKIDQLTKRGVAITVIDAPLLLEADWGSVCDDIVFVDCPVETRLERALLRGWTKRQFYQREAAQWSIEEKQRASTIRIDNSGISESELVQRVQQLWDNLTAC
jgi:dephospho-CoA kinase